MAGRKKVEKQVEELEEKKVVETVEQPTEDTTTVEQPTEEVTAPEESTEVVKGEEITTEENSEKEEEEPVVESSPTEEPAPVEETKEPTEVKLEDVEKSIDEVDTDLKLTDEEEQPEEVKQLEELGDAMKELEANKVDFEKQMDENPENAAEIIEDQLKKANNIKNRLVKIKKSVDNAGFTNVWNGMGYDL